MHVLGLKFYILLNCLFFFAYILSKVTELMDIVYNLWDIMMQQESTFFLHIWFHDFLVIPFWLVLKFLLLLLNMLLTLVYMVTWNQLAKNSSNQLIFFFKKSKVIYKFTFFFFVIFFVEIFPLLIQINKKNFFWTLGFVNVRDLQNIWQSEGISKDNLPRNFGGKKKGGYL